MALLFQKYRR